MRGPSFEVEVDSRQFLQTLDSCIDAANQGQLHIVTKNGEQYVAVISMSEYEQLKRYKSLLDKAASEFLQGYLDGDAAQELSNSHSLQDGLQFEPGNNADYEDKNHRNTSNQRNLPKFIASIVDRLSRFFR